MSASMLFGKPNWGWGGANCDLYRGLFNLSAALNLAVHRRGLAFMTENKARRIEFLPAFITASYDHAPTHDIIFRTDDQSVLSRLICSNRVAASSHNIFKSSFQTSATVFSFPFD